MEHPEDKWHWDGASRHRRDTRQKRPGCGGRVNQLNTQTPRWPLLQEPSEEMPETTWVVRFAQGAAGSWVHRTGGGERNGRSALRLARCLQKSTAVLPESSAGKPAALSRPSAFLLEHQGAPSLLPTSFLPTHPSPGWTRSNITPGVSIQPLPTLHPSSSSPNGGDFCFSRRRTAKHVPIRFSPRLDLWHRSPRKDVVRREARCELPLKHFSRALLERKVQ